MLKVSSSTGGKRKAAAAGVVSEPWSKIPKVTLLSPSLILLKIPTGINTSLPVWQAMTSKEVDITWTVNPYSISVHLTPVTSGQGKSTTSSQRESTSSWTETVVCSPGILQPDMVVPNSYVLFSLPQTQQPFPTASTHLLPSPPGKPQRILPTLTPATSVLHPLPVIRTQPQPAHGPSTPFKKQVPLAITIPKPRPSKLQAASKVPVPSRFHTKSSSDVEICDDFLLSLCGKAKECKMHHTPYPFHWQLWCTRTLQWVNIPPQAQVLLERLYCDVGQEYIGIKDGPHRYSLNFDSMDLDEYSKYDSVRRLTNSDSPLKNPYFPSQWKIWWWNNHEWEEYSKELSTFLLGKMKEKEPECSFSIGSKEYMVDFTIMIQTNMATGYKREVRCRPLYRSPDSMKPYLKTGLHTEPVGDPPGENFNLDPLKEFSSWYPPVWGLASEQDFSLVDLPAGTAAYRSVQNFFYESLPETEVDIISIQQVQNILHWDKYQRHKMYMQKHHNSKEPLERHLFHGTIEEASVDICHNNFDPRLAGVNGTSHGFGTYFATKASFSNTFTGKTDSNEVRHMFLAKVLVGNVTVGKNNYRRPPPLNSKTRPFCRYDACVDSISNPAMFVVYDSCQCYPYYLIKYKDLPTEIEI